MVGRKLGLFKIQSSRCEVEVHRPMSTTVSRSRPSQERTWTAVCVPREGRGPALRPGRLAQPVPRHHCGVAAGGRSLAGDAACPPPEGGTGEGPGSRLLGEDHHPQRWLLEAGGSAPTGHGHLQVRDTVTMAMKPWRAPEIADVSHHRFFCFRCVLLTTSALKKEAIVSLLVGMFCMLTATDLAGVAKVTRR